METRQLAYFLAACQQQNHAMAAKELRIAPSTLSQNITELERELGLQLFRLGPAGFYPTLEARALYQDFEHALRAAEAAKTFARRARTLDISTIRVASSLKFSLGRVSKAAAMAARALAPKHPDIFFDIEFALHDPIRTPHAPSRDAGGEAPDVSIEYADRGGKRLGDIIATDSWFAVTGLNIPEYRRAEDALKVLRRVPLALPQLPNQVIDAAIRFCRENGLPRPQYLDEDIGALPRLATSGAPFCLFVPQSILSSRLKQLRLSIVQLPRSLSSPIVGRAQSPHPAARDFLARMKSILSSSETNNIYAPDISLKQMRYFHSLHEQRNMTTAARTLSVAQPALSCQLKNLERIIGARLFERKRDGLESNEVADRFAIILRKVTSRIDGARRKASQLTASQSHRVTVGIVPLAARRGVLVESLTAAITDWLAAHKGIDLRILEAPTETLHKWVNAGVANFALVEAIAPHASRIGLQSRDPLGLVTAKNANLVGTGDISFTQLADLPLLLPSQEFGMRRLLDEAADKARLHLSVQAEVNSLMMALALTAKGRFATIMPYATVRKAVADGELQFNKIVEPEVWRKLSIIFSAERTLTEIERSFVRLLKRHLAAHATVD